MLLRFSALGAAVLSLGLAAPAHALTDSTASTDFSAVGSLNGLAGILIAPNWVLTAAHVAQSVTANATSFSSTAGSAVVDGIYKFSNDPLLENDIALLHLSSSISVDLPVLNDILYTNAAAEELGPATLASTQGAQQEVGYALVTGARTVYSQNGSILTVNWLTTQGSTVESGDSGSALFLGVADGSAGQTLLGVASASLDSGSFSAYVQTAAYKSWIDSTMASSGQQAQWVSSPVPEPSSVLLMGLGGVAAVAWASKRRRAD